MIPLDITPAQSKRLKILTHYYFPEFKKVQYSACNGTKGYLSLFKDPDKKKPSLKIHWFEWTMMHLSNEICNRHGLLNHEKYEELKKVIMENYYAGEFKLHPIDLLYKQYLNVN